MRPTSTIAAMIGVLLGSASTVFAASGVREDSSGVLVWLFLGFCALIVIAQLLPAILLSVGLVAGVGKGREVALEKTPAE